MIPEGNLQSNIERFSGFAELYDQHRPEAPELVADILTAYLEKRPELVLDLGCGTGLSTWIWRDRAEQIIGVEPNDDMRSKAEEKRRGISGSDHVSFVSGYSNHLGASDASVDIITCSQSFHWMEPVSTLNEAHRVLRRGGIFAAYDCDWPPVLSWELEKAYMQLTGKADELIEQSADQEKQAVKRNKNEHLSSLEQSGLFRYTREIVFHNKETCDAERYVGLALSQGGLQTVFKLGMTELNPEIESFRHQAREYFNGESKEILFSYRMTLGIK
ncbi:methyltransferase family protein [Fontibacillus phaseoli]|uniref:Methyltransferase family protein n=1 Tax=Fontibacillus phaseoli TaxID=1416533 RepID=A0A369B7C6_9BACL|nr:class I SAM-dependent methyltransferase [Fontibacillus phaseoli]RCX16437.1 methyltransferase family protein [Fontibacillus phaseoli]